MAQGENGGEPAGRLLCGRYRVVGTLGTGGMGIVCRAVDEVLGREVAVKILRAYSDASAQELADLRARMQREARAAARIRHPGVITVHDVAEEDGRPVIVMELVDGPSLDDVLERHGALDPRRAAGVGARVAEALEAAHGAGVLHRDVKPGNVLLDRAGATPSGGDGSGRVVLTDFGIASMDALDAGAERKLTRSGQLVGSLDFLPPERAQGQEPGPASDLWSLGMTLYAAVEDSSPFRRASVWLTLNAIVTEELPEPRNAGPLAPVLRELMHKDPARRPSAARARQMLDAVASGTWPHRPPTAPAQSAGVPYVPPAAAGPQPYAGSAAFGPTPTTPLSHRPRQQRYEPAPLIPRQPQPAAPAAGDRPRGRRRAVLATAAAVVVLAGAGLAYALGGGSGGGTATASGSSAPSAGLPLLGGGAPGGRSSAPQSPSASGTPGGATHSAPAATPTAGRTKSPVRRSAPPKAPPASPKPAGPSCAAIAGDRFDCHTWRQADSYTASGAHAGILKAGTNYFYCQADLRRRETYGSWTNVWWAKTDDDSGNSGVWVSDVYITGGANDRPIPGLPTC